MTVKNVKNMPDLPRTDDVGTIMGNFVSYYGELYCDKPIDMPTLDRMIGNLTLKLDEKDVTTDTNVSLVKVTWEKETIWLVTAYFPNDIKGTIAPPGQWTKCSAKCTEPGSSWQETSTPQKHLPGPPLVVF